MDKIERLKELSDLLNSGAITKDEYEVMKAEVINLKEAESLVPSSGSQNTPRTGIGWQEITAIITGIIGGIVYAILTKQKAKKKLIVFLLSFLLQIVVGLISNSKQTVETATPEISNKSSSQVEPPTQNANTNSQGDKPQQNSLALDSSDVFTEFQTISFECGTPQDFDGLTLSADCPLDADKDDRPDKPSSDVTFSNPSDKVVYLSFPEGITGSVDTIKTATILPQGSITREVNNSQFEIESRKFKNLQVGLGKVQVSTLPDDVFSTELSCNSQVEGASKKQFGVTYKLSCDKEKALQFSNEAAGKRVANVTYTDTLGTKWIQSIILIDQQSTYVLLPDATTYQLEILIPQAPETPQP